MRPGKNISRGRIDANQRNGASDANKGRVVAATSSNRSSESDDDNVRQQLSASSARRTNGSRTSSARGPVASRRNGITVGPGSDSDNRASGASDDDEHGRTSSTRSARRAGTDSPATTPVGSPSQTPGPGTSSSEGVSQQTNGMDVDTEGDRPVRRSAGDRSEHGTDARPSEAGAAEASGVERPFNIAYIPCHTWPPCAVCAGIAGQPPPTIVPSAFMRERQKQLEIAREAARNAAVARPLEMNGESSSNPPQLRPPPLARPSEPMGAQPDFVPPPLSPPPMPYDPPTAYPPRANGNIRPEPGIPQRMPGAPGVYAPQNYPMEPLFVSAGVAPGPQSGRGQFRGAAPPSAGRGMQPIPHVIRQVTLSSVSAPVRPHPYARPQRGSAQPSSSSLRIEDMRTPQNANGAPNGTRLRGRNKQKSKKVRAKRYNRKKREEWPPEGWNPIWEEERPRRWEGYDIPDDVPTDKVYEHLRRKFDLKSMGHCRWEGCIPTEASRDGYKMLKRHVETVHLGLKLVCRLCGVRKRADNRRKATHKRGCPEREDGTIAMPPEDSSASTSTLAQPPIATQPGTDVPHADTRMGDDAANNDDDGHDGDEEGSAEEEDELEEDELEEDQLDEDQEDGMDHPMESEFESEDD